MVAGELVIFGSDDRRVGGVGYVYAFEQATGKVRWKYRAGAGVMADIVRQGDRLYAVTLQDELICLDLASGHAAWTVASGWVNDKMVNVMASPAVEDGLVIFGGHNDAVQALDAKSGQPVWKREVGAAVVTPLGVANHAVYFGTSDQKIHRLSLRSDATHAELALGGNPFGPPTVIGDSVLLMVYDKPDIATLKSFDLDLKEMRWSRETPGGWSSARPCLWRDGILVGSQEGLLSAFSRDGSQKWSDTVGRVIRGIGTSDDVLYVGTLKGTLYAYQLAGVRREQR